MHFCESQCNWFVSKWTYFSLLVPFWRSPIYLNAKECNITGYQKKKKMKKKEEPNDDYMKNFYKSLYFEIQNSRSNCERWRIARPCLDWEESELLQRAFEERNSGSNMDRYGR